MSIKRTRMAFEGHFVQIPNAWLRDKRLSRRARGLLAELMTHREGYTLSVKQLVASGIEGRDAIRHAINELASYGYLRVVQTRDGGKFGEVEFELAPPTVDGFSGAGEAPGPEKPATVSPAPVNPHPKNTTKDEEHQGEEETAPSLSAPLLTTPEPSLYCDRHPDGTTRACRGCKLAREAHEQWLLDVSLAAPAPTPKYDPDVYCEHLQIKGRCDICDAEAARAARVIEAQFGNRA